MLNECVNRTREGTVCARATLHIPGISVQAYPSPLCDRSPPHRLSARTFNKDATMSLPRNVTIIEVGPREGFQFEGIGQPQKIATADKVRLIEMLADTGVKTIQMSSFVSPKQVPQMADAEQLCATVTPRPGVKYT